MKKHLYIRLGILSIVLISTVGLFADVTSGHHDDTVSTAYCPVMPDEPVDPEIWTLHEGRKIYLCCKKCKREFLADPDKYLPPSTVSSMSVHDHETGHEGERDSMKAITMLGKFHPMVVHFPIALLLTAFLSELVGVSRKAVLAHDVARVLVVVGAVGAVFAAGLGWIAAGNANYPGDLSVVLWRHRWLGVSVAVLSVVAATFSCIHKNRKKWVWIYRGLLALTALLVGMAGHFGATLIYGLDYFTW